VRLTTTNPFETAASFCQAGETLLKSGLPLVAYDTLASGLKQFPADARLRQLLALSLARSGATRRANDILTELSREGHRDEETLGLLARTHKDLSAAAIERADRMQHLQLALRYYRDGYAQSNGYYSGINAATLALLVGETSEAAALARAVREQCVQLERAPGDRRDRYWILATLGEAALILGQWSEAADWYRQAVAIGVTRSGDLASTRRNARLIIRHLGSDAAAIEQLLRVRSVVVFSGHLIDRPTRTNRRFPPALEPMVRAAIRERLKKVDVGFGYGSAGCGGDILFHEAVRELGGESHVVLPYDRDQFRRDSVDIVPGADWGQRYDRVLAEATDVVIASDQRTGSGGMSYEYGLLVLDGTAGIRADELESDLVSLAVWDGKPGDGPGGTATSVERWRNFKRPIEIVDLSTFVHAGPPPDVSIASPPRPAVAAAFKPAIVGLLFADVRGFSKLTEDEIPLFVEHFLGTVALEVGRSREAPLVTNTWGDGLYFVFGSVRDTGVFALDLCDAVLAMDWRAKGFRDDLTIRIGLHAGPTYECTDPVTKRKTYIGAHVSRAARIEPITPPGEVYASRAFAAIARADQVTEFACSYVGQTPLGKDYGIYPTYVVHRRRGERVEASFKRG